MERVTWKLTLLSVKQLTGICRMTQETQTRFCINREGWHGEETEGRFKREGMYVYLWLWTPSLSPIKLTIYSSKHTHTHKTFEKKKKRIVGGVALPSSRGSS